MPLFCFRCPSCDSRVETTVRDPAPTCTAFKPCAGLPMTRDFRAESVGIGAGVRATRYADSSLILPNAKDFAGPGDQDGTKGLRQWNEDHRPSPSNHAPRRPGGREIRRFF